MKETIVICGKSGSGKSTVAKLLEKEYDFRRIVTFTTRPIREGEKDSIDYRFVSKEAFEIFKEAGFFAETADYKTADGIWSYGSAKLDYESDTRHKVIVLTPEGVKAIRKAGVECICVYLKAENDILSLRLSKRGDDAAEISRRLKNDDVDFADAEEFADITINTDAMAVEEIAATIMEATSEKICA